MHSHTKAQLTYKRRTSTVILPEVQNLGFHRIEITLEGPVLQLHLQLIPAFHQLFLLLLQRIYLFLQLTDSFTELNTCKF